MRWIYKLFAITCIAACGCDVTTPAANQTDIPEAANTFTPAADNTAINQRDRAGSAKTPFDQSNSQPDLDLTAKIRQRVVDLPDLSLNARNVKIITAGGKVTLRGPVDTAAERSAIEKIAHDVAGQDKVDNQLEVIAK